MENQPMVSVIVPVYNNEAYLKEGLDSLLAQTMQDIEIICVDDGSTDHSYHILKEYAKNDSRIKVIKQKNRGAGAARNTGFLAATGEYVYFFDSDDLCDEHLFEKTLAVAQREDADIVCFNFDRFDAEGNRAVRKGYHAEWLPPTVTVFNYLICPDRILSVINPTPWNKLIRRTFIEENNLKYEEITSTNDITFASVCAAKAERIAVHNDVLYHYRVGHENTISSGKAKNLNNIVVAVESVVRQVKELPYYETIKNSLHRFEVDNYVFALSHYITDFQTPEAKAFYTHVHERFNAPEYECYTQQECGYKKLFDIFKIIRANDYDTLSQNYRRKLIVSLTTFPARIKGIRQVIDTIYAQSRTPDLVILWLAEEQFPRKELDLPYSVMELVLKKKLVVRWCDDLKPHKKYYYALQEYRDDLIVTVDDDLLYHPNLLENLYTSYLLHPDAVSAARAHLITMGEDGQVLPYDCWVKEIDSCVDQPSMQLLCTGGAGALYPAHLFKPEVFDKQAILDNCLFADDLWLKFMELLSGIPVVISEAYMGLKYVPGSQVETLCSINVGENQNDQQFEMAVEWAEEKFGKGCISEKLIGSGIGTDLSTMEVVCQFYEQERKKQAAKLKKAYQDKADRGTEIKKLQAQINQLSQRGTTTIKKSRKKKKGIGEKVKRIGKKIIPQRMQPFVKRMLLRIPHKTKTTIKRIIRW